MRTRATLTPMTLFPLSAMIVQDLERCVYFWIGAKSSLDKQASAAINSVNLRAYLHVDSLCQVAAFT